MTSFLDLDNDMLLHIFKQVSFNFCLINKQCKTIHNANSDILSNETYIYESIDILKWGLLNGYRINKNTFPMAILDGNLEIIEWLFSMAPCYSRNKKVFNKAAKNGNLKNMQWLLDNNFSWTYEVYYGPIENTNVETILWLYNKGCPLNENIFNYAILYGDLDIISTFKNLDCPFGIYTFINAVKIKICEILVKYLIVNINH